MLALHTVVRSFVLEPLSSWDRTRTCHHYRQIAHSEIGLNDAPRKRATVLALSARWRGGRLSTDRALRRAINSSLTDIRRGPLVGLLSASTAMAHHGLYRLLLAVATILLYYGTDRSSNKQHSTGFFYADACYLQGTDSGECTTKTLDPLWKASWIPFCSDVVLYPACVPKIQPVSPSKEFPNGRWFSHDARTKDSWVKKNSLGHMAEQILHETNLTLRALNVDQNGIPGRVRRRFYHQPPCRWAYSHYFCWINFPRCDDSQDLTLPMCRSACENFFRACNYADDLYRCGPAKFFNGYEPEEPSEETGTNSSYLREYFPGQPFRDNKYDPLTGAEMAVCTPAILGAASAGARRSAWVGLAALATGVLVLFWA